VAATIDREWHHYVYNAMGQIISEYGPDGVVRERIYRGGEMLATTEAIGVCGRSIRQFVESCYWGALGRQPTADEESQESIALRSEQSSGQSRLLTEAQRFGKSLFNSDEYAQRNRSDREYIHDLYWSFLQRSADERGYQFWLDNLQQHGRAAVLEAFAGSQEFVQHVGELCQTGAQTEAVQWQLTDHTGSVRVILNETANVLARHDYLPFGDYAIAGPPPPQSGMTAPQAAESSASTEQIESTGFFNWQTTQLQRYGEMESDPSTGLRHTDWRKYDDWQGRWTTTDPAHSSMSVGDPQSFNRYAYVSNDPVNLVDPDGQFAIPLITAGVGAAIGGVGYTGGLVISNVIKGRSAFDGFSGKALAVAVGTGAVAGLVAPYTATTLVGSAITSGVANLVQYAGTQYVTNQPITLTGAGISAGFGAVSGPAAGLFVKAAPYSPSFRGDVLDQVVAANSNNAAIRAANTGLTTLFRNAGVSIVTNAVPSNPSLPSNNTTAPPASGGGGAPRDPIYGGSNRRYCPSITGCFGGLTSLDLLYLSSGRGGGTINGGNLGTITVYADGSSSYSGQKIRL